MRAKNMQALTDDLKKAHPGIVIYGVGDDAHRLRVSDHNEDDTPGVRAAQSDADNIPEHRAIDAMLGTHFTMAQANTLIANLLADSSARARLYYLIFNGSIWSRDSGWKKEKQVGDQHTDHVHFSGLAAQDDNTASWPAVFGDPQKPKPPHVLQKGDSGEEVRWIQNFFRNVFPSYRDTVTYMRGHLIEPDGVFGDQTVAWVKEFQKRTGITQDGKVGPVTFAKLRSYGYAH